MSESERDRLDQHAADVATSCGECGVTAMFCATSLNGACCDVCDHTPGVVALVKRAREAEAAASHTHAVFVRAVPDEEVQGALWRDHWRAQLAARAALPTPESTP